MAQDKNSLSDIWKLKQRGKRDSERQKKLVERAIRKNGKDLITEYNIIKSDGEKKIKIPIKFLDQYRFKYGKLNKDESVGQGLNGKAGDKFQLKKKDPGNSAGDEEGERTFEAEITIDELVNILLEELNLPWMDPKNTSKIEIENEEMTTVDRRGILPNIDLKRSLLENVKRNAAKGNAKVGNFSQNDLRYKSWEIEKEYHSNAAIYLLMDRSASMDNEKTYIAKSFYFWMVQFLKRRYKKIDLIFIAHDTKAFIVDEKDFFAVSSNGGTTCSSAYKLAYENIKIHHPPDLYNTYLYHFSDGDNWQSDNEICVEYAQLLLPMVRAMGYGEILDKENNNAPWHNDSHLLSNYFNKKIQRTKFLSMQFENKDDVYLGLKKFFNINGSNKK